VAVCAVNSAAAGEAHARALLSREPPPDAIAAMSDELALGAMRAAAQAGHTVPDAVAITGWDDSGAAALAGLSTVEQSLREQGARCARQILDEGRADAELGEPPWRVVVRGSTRG
jgi:DNA-binding LacI/PurR family transcriptional regulator